MTGLPDEGATHRDGVALMTTRKRKEDRYPDFVGPKCRTHLVVLACEVGGK